MLFSMDVQLIVPLEIDLLELLREVLTGSSPLGAFSAFSKAFGSAHRPEILSTCWFSVDVMEHHASEKPA